MATAVSVAGDYLIGELHICGSRYLLQESRSGLNGDRWFRILEPNETLPKQFLYRTIGSEDWKTVFNYPCKPPCHQQAGYVYCVECAAPTMEYV